MTKTILRTLAVITDELLDTSALDVNSERLAGKIASCRENMANLVEENARKAMNQEVYLQQFSEMKAELDSLTAKRGKVEAELLTRRARKTQISEFIQTLNAGVMTEFDAEVFRAVVESMEAGKNKGLILRFVNGAEVKV